MANHPEQEQTFVRVTPVTLDKVIAHIGHPTVENNLLIGGGKYIDVAYDASLEISFNPETEMLIVYRKDLGWRIAKVGYK